MKNLNPLIAAFFMAFLAGPAHVASSAWHQFEGGALRVVVSEQPDPEGRTRAALEIALEPGWKTYWLDPGSSGVPPTVTGSAGIEGPVRLDMPAPLRLSDGYGSFAGYDRPVALALTFDAATGAVEAAAFDVFLGVCETICIPVQATLTADQPANNSADEVAVATAFAALPGTATTEFGVAAAWTEGEELIVEVALPEGVDVAELFVALLGVGADPQDDRAELF